MHTSGDVKTLRLTDYVGLALTSLCVLMLELTLTRIFSVIMWYHFAFVAISVALLGIAASGLMVFLFPKAFSHEKLSWQLPLFTSLMSVSIVAALVVILRVPFLPRLSIEGLASCGVIYGTIAIPFFLAGASISLLLLHHGKQVSGLYFTDLLGGGFGCLATLAALNIFTGPEAMLLIAVIAGAAAVCFSIGCDRRHIALGSRLTFLVAVLFFVFGRDGSLTSLQTVKNEWVTDQGVREENIFEKWNSFSRVTASPPKKRKLLYSRDNPSELPQPLHMTIKMKIDAAAATEVVQFDGDFDKVKVLKYDISSLAHWIKTDASVLIIGPGGGRDVLAALASGQKSVTGVEINPIIVDAIREDFRYFASDIYNRPEVEIYIDEGRSFMARSEDEYDIIQATLVDTWAATSSGAFALTENNLYTREAFETYLEHLTDDGALSFTRWYFSYAPGETLRLAALGIEALESIGYQNPAEHVFVARGGLFATVLFKKSPFSAAELGRIHDACERMGFEIIYSPKQSGNPVFSKLFDKPAREKLYREYALNITPPTDDKPFFFQTSRIRSLFSGGIEKDKLNPFTTKSMGVLASLLVTTTLFAFLFLLLPPFLFRSLKPRELIPYWKYLAYFMLIGFGFIMIEIPLIQRFTLLLGHPIYSLAVVLFSILVCGSLGSLYTRRVTEDNSPIFLRKALLWLILFLTVYLIFLPTGIHLLIGVPTYVGILATLALIAPLGFLMGMPFPLGIKILTKEAQFLIPWCWGLNGAFSVFASVATIAVAISFGFSVVMAVGGMTYVAAMFVVVLLKQR